MKAETSGPRGGTGSAGTLKAGGKSNRWVGWDRRPSGYSEGPADSRFPAARGHSRIGSGVAGGHEGIYFIAVDGGVGTDWRRMEPGASVDEEVGADGSSGR